MILKKNVSVPSFSIHPFLYEYCFIRHVFLFGTVYVLNFIFCLYFIDLVFTFLFYHLPFSTFIFLNLSSLAFIVLYFPPLTFIVLHQPPFTFNYNYLPSYVIVELHCLHFGFNISSSHLFYHTLPHCPLSTSFAFIYLHLP